MEKQSHSITEVMLEMMYGFEFLQFDMFFICCGLFMYEQYVFSGVIGTPASSAERVCLVVHKVDFV